MKINHKITIYNLGPIDLIEELEVKNINILIGESGKGKSIIAKTAFIFNDFFHHPTFSISIEESLKEKLQKTLERFFYDYENYKIKYQYSDDYYIEANKTSKKLNINFSKKLQDKINFIENEVEKSALFQGLVGRDTSQGLEKIDKKRMQELYDAIKKDEDNKNKAYSIRRLVNELGLKETIFIPASRSFLLDLNDVIINSLLSGAEAMDEKNFEHMMLRFSKEYSKYKKLFNGIHKDFNQILKGSIISEGNQFKFKPNGKRSAKSHISLSSLSSGQKEIFPIAVILSKLIQDKKQILLIIEEPEAHLFPEDQLKIFEILVYFANISNSQLIITTHSPYICYIANNMLLANKIKTIKKNKTIDPKNCQVNFLEDGKAKSILQNEEIDTDYIDSASQITLKNYHELIAKENE
jgi:predicted ATPase